MNAGGSEAAIRSTYDVVADAYADHFRGTEPEQRVELAMIDYFVALLPEGAAVLDAGCGAGRMLPYVAALGAHPRGVDLSARMIARARRDHPEFETGVGSLTALPFADASFDGVLAWYSTIHLDDDGLARALAEALRVTKPGGLLLVGFQSGDGVREVGAGFRRRGFDVELLRWHRSPEAMRTALERAGWRPEAELRRSAAGAEQDDQAVILARRDDTTR